MGRLVPQGHPASRRTLRELPEARRQQMSGTEFHHYTREQFVSEFFPDAEDKAAITAKLHI